MKQRRRRSVLHMGCGEGLQARMVLLGLRLSAAAETKPPHCRQQVGRSKR